MKTTKTNGPIDFSPSEYIRVADMLNVMNQRDGNGDFIPFGSITFVKLDLKRNLGGEKVTLENAVLNSGGKNKNAKRNPNHYENYTRNIKSVDGDRIMKIRVLLVTRFNGYKIIL